MRNEFKPYANESDVLRIGALEIENRVDRVTLMGDVELTRDREGLAKARELKALIGRVVKALESEKRLPRTVALKPVEVVKNPFL